MNGMVCSVFFVCIISAAVLSVPVVLIVRLSPKARKWKLTLYVFALVFAARFAVSFFDIRYSGTGLTGIETFFDSIVHALQTFSLDEDYTSYTLLGKEMLLAAGYPVLSAVYGILISVLDVCAPVLGGALLLEILAGIFPRVKLACRPFCHKFVFSALNAEAVTLAEDLFSEKKYRECLPGHARGGLRARPMVVFTDAYRNESSERESELFDRAKKIGAVCIRSDLQNLPFRRSGTVDYFLIDADFDGDIRALSQLLSVQPDGKLLWPDPAGKRNASSAVRIFVFTRGDADVSVVKNICEKKRAVAEKVIVRTIDDYRNTAVSLMSAVPLFLPLLTGTEKETKGCSDPDTGKAEPVKKKKFIQVTILGSGRLAGEVFKAAFWSGQIPGVQLRIRVVSETATVLLKHLEENCPELIESCRPDAALLRVSPFSEERNAPYAGLAFYDVPDAMNLSDYPDGILRETDYFVAALGDDRKNAAVSGRLKLTLSRMMLEGERGDAVIVPAIFDDAAAEAAAQETPGKGEPRILPFAMMRERFACGNIFMTGVADAAAASARLYDKAEQERIWKDEYSYWANTARALHAPYKLFGIGMIRHAPEGEEGKRFLVQGDADLDAEEIKDVLAWTEHRRWNAFLRTEGFACASKEQYDNYYKETKKHKNVSLKLHNCLVESRAVGFAGPGEWDPLAETAEECLERLGERKAEYDYLDLVSMKAYEKDCRAGIKDAAKDSLADAEYKHYDYPAWDDALMRMTGREESQG